MRHRPQQPLLPAILFLRGLAAGLAAESKVTYNGCKCKKTWEEGSTKCDDYCCLPDSDKWGKWCMVEDIECEDSDWGYCFDWGPANRSQPASGCTDVPDWRDLDGDTCFSYQSNVWCTRGGKEGHGWHADEWGPLNSFSANGYSALDACCACGGGKIGAPSTRHTYNLCKCKTSWQMGDLTCQSSCCNPDDDVSGSWCVVQDFNCEDEVWGYCRPSGGSTQRAPPATGRHGHCNDTVGWKDIDGESCQAYADYAYCTEVGGYGLGWNIEWGSFGSFAEDGVTGADFACCACGGGQHDPHFTEDMAEQLRDWEFEKVKTTMNGCECKRQWTMKQVKCENYCCGDEPWCEVKDENCEGATWGYCRESGLGTIARPQFDADHCEDIEGWVDKDSDGCSSYQKWLWCTSTGTVGSGWHQEWGTIGGAQSRGHTAFSACCACGGGIRDGEETEPGIVETVKSFMYEEDAFMWRVISGPCTMDDKGCIMSGNFPKKYSPEEQCQIAVDNEMATPIQVASFDTEQHYDVLKINGKMYSGGKKPNGVVPKGTIHWGADRMDAKSGWKLCPRGRRARNPVVRVIKILGMIVLALLLCCCLAVVGLWINMKRNMPSGDGLGAGPIGYGKKYAKQASEGG